MKNYVIKAVEEYEEGGLTRKAWRPIGRLTIFNDQSRGVLSLNMIPGVTYQIFETENPQEA